MNMIVNVNIRMNKKYNIKMYKIVHSFYYTFRAWRYSKMKNLNKLRQELLVMDTLEIKPNYSQLAREHECDWRTILCVD